MKRTTMLGAAAAGTLAVSTGIALGTAYAAGESGPQATGEPASRVLSRDSSGVTTCKGGKQRQTVTQINNNPTTIGEGAATTLPGASVVVSGPKRGYDVLDITFSAETQLRGTSTTDLYDWMELEVLVDGKPVQPFGPPASPLAISGSPHYASNAAQFCTRIGKGKHKVTVVSRLVDNGTPDSLSGWFDDTTLHVERSE